MRQPGAMIIAATFAILVGLWMDRLLPPPLPIQPVQVDYCWIDYYLGHHEWGEGYGLCSDQDIYRNI